MADTQPGNPGPAEAVDRTLREPGPAETVDRTLREPGPAETVDRTKREERQAPADPTAPAPMRWAGSAAVPAPPPRRSRWDDAEDDDWAATPAVDPWAGQDTPWDLIPPPPPHTLPPTLTAPPVPPPAPTLLEPPPAPPQPIPPAATATPAPPATKATPAPTPPATKATPAPTPPATKATPAPAPAPAPAPTRKTVRAEAKRQRALAAPTGKPQPLPPSWAAGRPAAGPPTGSMSRRDWTRPPPVPEKNRNPLPPRPRRKRRWPANLALFSLLSFACCCGIPAYYAWPAARQYPVSASLPDTVGDLTLRDDDASKNAADRLGQQMRDENASVDSVFAGVYGDRNGKRVTVFGVTGLRLAPGSDVKKQLARLSGTYDLGETSSFDLGESGVHELCGVGKAVVVCAWADHGSLATVILTRRSLDDSADLVGVLRSAVLTRG